MTPNGARPLVSANTVTFGASLPAIVTAVASAGFDGLEVWQRDLEGDARAAANVLRREGLRPTALQLLRDFEGGPVDQMGTRLDTAKALMDDCALLGADTILLCANTEPGCSGDAERQAADLRLVAELAAERGLRIGFEPLAWSRWINRYEIAWDRVQRVDHPALGLVVDAFHLFSTDTPPSFLEEVPVDRCFVVQLCDAVPMDLPAIEIARHHRLFPGEGVWPVSPLARRLHERGYRGFYNIEVFNDAYRLDDPARIAARAVQSFRDLFATTLNELDRTPKKAYAISYNRRGLP